MKNFLFIVVICFFMFGCDHETNHAAPNITDHASLKYAKRFKMAKASNYTLLQLLGDKNSDKVTATFVLYKGDVPKLDNDFYYIKTPVSTIASMSSIYTTMLDELGCINKIVAIDNVDYYNNKAIIKQVSENKIIELSKGPNVDVEKTIALNPNLFLTFGMGNPKEDVDIKLVNAKIPSAICLDHLEETPLARAEWLKFIACFVGMENTADSIFNVMEKSYNELKAMASEQVAHPSVLTEIKYGDAWYVPGGNSYMANLIADAGGTYFWKNENKTGSIPLSFEMVYAKAQECDVWLNLYNVNSKQELMAYDTRYKLFSAYSKNNLYNNNKTQNSKGFSNYWETGISQPHFVLNDLIAILYPQLFPNYSFHYYKQIN